MVVLPFLTPVILPVLELTFAIFLFPERQVILGDLPLLVVALTVSFVYFSFSPIVIEVSLSD
jgi:hypothetical protein